MPITLLVIAVEHRDENGHVVKRNMRKCGEDCPVRGDLFMPVDITFPYSVLLLMGKHNHPPPPPEKTPSHVKQKIAAAAKHQQPQHFSKLTSRERLAALALIHRVDISHPSFAKRQRARQLVPTPTTTPPEVHRLPDQIALFQLFCSGSNLVADYLHHVSFDGERFVAFAMSKSGAMILARARVVDIDMTFKCTRGHINMVKIVAYDVPTNVATTVARAWVDRQDAETYRAIILALNKTFTHHTGQPLHFSAYDRVKNTVTPPASIGKLLMVAIDAIRLDLDGGQALGLGEALVDICPVLETPENALAHVAVPCTIHFGRNVAQSGLSSFARKLLLSLKNCWTAEAYDDRLQELLETPGESSDKVKGVVGKYSQEWVRVLFPAYSKMPQHILASVCTHTNTIESTNHRDHLEVGTHLALTDYVIKAKAFDSQDHGGIAMSEATGVPLVYGSSRADRDAVNEKRRTKSEEKGRAKSAATSNATSKSAVKTATSKAGASSCHAKRSRVSAPNSSEETPAENKKRKSAPTTLDPIAPVNPIPTPPSNAPCRVAPPAGLTPDLLAYYAGAFFTFRGTKERCLSADCFQCSPLCM